jgi:hypothetical protein
MKNVKMVLMTE